MRKWDLRFLVCANFSDVICGNGKNSKFVFLHTESMHYLKLNRAHLLFLILVFSLWGCKKHTYSACFNMDKSTISVGDSVVLSNCSNFDGGYTECLWDFGDGKSEFSNGTDVIKHQYNTLGQFEVKLTIGEKENSSVVSKAIIVK